MNLNEIIKAEALSSTRGENTTSPFRKKKSTLGVTGQEYNQNLGWNSSEKKSLDFFIKIFRVVLPRQLA